MNRGRLSQRGKAQPDPPMPNAVTMPSGIFDKEALNIRLIFSRTDLGIPTPRLAGGGYGRSGRSRTAVRGTFPWSHAPE
jgi:hypothetical protein